MYCVIEEIKYSIGSVVISVVILHTFFVESTNLCMCVCVYVCEITWYRTFFRSLSIPIGSITVLIAYTRMLVYVCVGNIIIIILMINDV